MNFKSHEVDFMHVIDLPSQLTRDETKDLESEIKKWLESPKAVHVLNFHEVLRVDQCTYRPFITYNKALRDARKFLYCINLHERLHTQLVRDGLDTALVSVQGLDAIRQKHLPEKAAVDVNIINPFLESTVKVMGTQANTIIKPGRPYVKNGDDPFPIEIAGLISLSSEGSFRGALALCFQASTFLKIYNNMVGEDAKEISSEIQDGAGELINIIYGQAKTALNDKGYNLQMALPTVLVGDKLKIRHQGRAQTIILPFESDAGPMFIEIMIERN
ncbi:MAG: hypothetical protein HC883_06445 [Bdellovibrionaceae bacterium]|nr:hypothetical protein [Pseudobdellovibrionaceae bacterium]